MRTKSHYIFYVIFALSIGASIYILQDFISTLVFAFFSTYLFYPIYAKFYRLTRSRRTTSVILTTASVLLVAILPLAYVVSFAIHELSLIDYNNFESNLLALTQTSIDSILDDLPLKLDRNLIVENVNTELKNFLNRMFRQLLLLGNSALNTTTLIIVYLFSLAVFLKHRITIRKKVIELSPFKEEITLLYARKMKAMFLSIAKGTLIIAIIQSILSVTVFYWLGFTNPILLSFLVFVTSFIPYANILIFGSIIIYFLIIGQFLLALFMLLFYALIISSVDNVVRPLTVSGDSYLHPLIMLLSVFGGLSAFGIIGLIYGPMIVVITKTSFEVYLKYFKLNKQSKR